MPFNPFLPLETDYISLHQKEERSSNLLKSSKATSPRTDSHYEMCNSGSASHSNLNMWFQSAIRRASSARTSTETAAESAGSAAQSTE